MDYQDAFSNNLVPAAGLGYVSVVLTASQATNWPYNYVGDGLVTAAIMDVACEVGNVLSLPPVDQVSVGEAVIVRNVGANALRVHDSNAVTLAVIAAGVAQLFWVKDNVYPGAWGQVTYGAGTAAAAAGALAGFGTKATGATLSVAAPVLTIASSLSLTVAHRGQAIEFTGGAGSLRLDSASTYGSDFFCYIKNSGSGLVTITPSAGGTIDGQSALSLQPSESLILLCTGSTGWFSVGYGRSILYQFSQLALDVSAGGTFALSSAQASNKILVFTGNPATEVSIIVPSVISVYYVANKLSTAQNIQVRTSGSPGAIVGQSQRIILVCDGAIVTATQSSIANGPLSLLDGSEEAPSLNFASQTNTGLFKYSSGGFGISSQGVAQLYSDGGGVEFPLGLSQGGVIFKTSNTGSMVLPVGDSLQRDAYPQFGMLRGNQDTGSLEYFTGTEWDTINGSSVMNEESFTATEGQTIFVTVAPYTVGVDALSIFINGLEQASTAYTETDNHTVTFSEGLSAGDHVEMRWGTAEFLSETDASLVSYLPAGTGAVTTTVQSKLRETVSVKDFGAVGDGVTDDTAAVQAAVTHCFTTGDQLYWPAGSYLTTGNITSFHLVRHTGVGVILRGSDTWHVAPTDTQRNIIYVSNGGSYTFDGLSAAQPTTISGAFNILKSYTTETLNGIWRIQFSAETFDDPGVTLEELPYFKNKLEIFGADVDETVSAVPTTVWDGAATTGYALRLDSAGYPSAIGNIFYKNIKFTNWTSGAIVAWSHGNFLFHNIHTLNCPVGIWGRHGYFKVRYGKHENCTTWGIGIQYNGTGNIGSLTAGTGVTFVGCGDGVSVGRFTVCYIQGNTFSGSINSNVDVEWLARCRTQANVLGAVAGGTGVISCAGNSLFTDDNASGYPNTFPTLTEAMPYQKSRHGSVNPYISRYSQKALHSYSGIQLEAGFTPITIFSVTTTSQILMADGAYGGSDFVPFRLPAYALYSPTFELEVKLGIALNVNAGGTLVLCGQGAPGGASELCRIDIPAAATYRNGFINLKIMNTPNASSARYEWFFPVTSLYKTGNTGSLNSSAIRANNDATLVYRLYWTSLTTDQVQLYGLRTYVIE